MAEDYLVSQRHGDAGEPPAGVVAVPIVATARQGDAGYAVGVISDGIMRLAESQAAGVLLSRLTGVARDVVIGAFFGTGIAVAPVPDQRLYDTAYQERYMGLPQENAEGYRRGSPITHAEGLRGNLLLVHGTGDDNVHYQGTERLINRLIELGKPFDMMAYPNRSHGIYEGAGTTLHVYSLLTRYLMDHVPAGGG